MKSAVAKGLRLISLGKYQTTLYNKNGSPFMSSVLGGIITLFFILLIGAYSLSILVAIIGMDRYNLDVTSQEIRSYKLLRDGIISKNDTNCESKSCRDIKVKDYQDIYSTLELYLIGTSVNSSFNITAYISVLDDQEQRKLKTVPFIVADTFSVFYLSSMNLNEALTEEEAE